MTHMNAMCVAMAACKKMDADRRQLVFCFWLRLAVGRIEGWAGKRLSLLFYYVTVHLAVGRADGWVDGRTI